ncbi:MAG TPA: hypothetical protein VLU54_00285 [Casimicrobiaceae bacterium]|nr:hypothetical protein [Casimicrobiaceae bacterium]
MADRIVLAFSGQGANDAIRGMMEAYGEALTAAGLSVVHVSTQPEELQYAASQVASGAVAFGITWLGIAQDLSAKFGSDPAPKNLWEACGVPLVKFQGDIPAYFSDFHRDVPLNSVNLYGAAEFLRFRRRWLPDASSMAGLVPPMALDPCDRSRIDASTRSGGKLVFLKNGNSPEELQRLWHQRLPPSISTLLVGMASEATPPAMLGGPFHVGDFAADYLQSEHIDPESVRYLIPFFAAQIDDFLRRVKSTMIAEAIADLPVIIQGRNWHHLDLRGRKAMLVEGQDYVATRSVYMDQLGIIDMSPNVDSSPHERVQRVAGSYALALTNRQGWLRDNFEGYEDLTFDFTPESIRARVSDVISNPRRYVDLGLAFGERFRTVFDRGAFADRVIRAADLVALQWLREKPVIQPFFSWPRR